MSRVPVHSFLEKIRKELTIKDLGEVNQFLGMQVEYGIDGSWLLGQSKYIDNMARDFNLENAKPLDHIVGLKEGMTPFSGPYLEIVGSLNYISTCTRPDIVTIVSILSRYNTKPTREAWECAKNVVRYLMHTKGLKLEIPKTKGIEILAYCDSDFAADVEGRRSRAGVVLTVNTTPVIWESKLGKTPVLSTCEAEYVSLTECMKHILWLKNL